MKILLDEKKINLRGSFNNLEAVLQEILNNHMDDERVVWSVKLNEEAYSEKEPNDAQRISADDIQILEIFTKGKNEIFQDFLQNSGGIIDVLKESAVKISGLFRMADEKEANQHFSEFLGAYHDFFQMIAQVHDDTSFVRDMQIDGVPIIEKVELLNELLDKMITSQEKEDWIMLADLLEYELGPAVEEWKGILSEIT